MLAAGTLVATSCLPLNSHPHSFKMMCNLCGKRRLNKQSKDSSVSTRVQFVFLHVCSHVGPVQLCEFRPGSFCLFPSRVWDSDTLLFISLLFSPSPYLQGGDRTKVQIFVLPGLTRFYIVLRALSLFSCLSALATLKYRKKLKVIHLRNKTAISLAGEERSRTWQRFGNGKECEEQKSLKQSCPCLGAKGSSMVIAGFQRKHLVHEVVSQEPPQT